MFCGCSSAGRASSRPAGREGIAPDSTVRIEPQELLPDTYSPLRDRYPGQPVCLSYRELIDYTLSLSDNNTCDWLIRFAGGIERVEAHMKALGIGPLRLTETEAEMHADIGNSYRNWSTPLAIGRLLQKLYTEEVLRGVYFDCPDRRC